MKTIIEGGYHNYGELAGILMLDSLTPRIPGDPGHAATFSYPVRYGVAHGFPFDDLVSGESSRLHLAVDAVRKLEQSGVRFIAADCGLFSIFQKEIAEKLSIPFIGSALDLVPMIKKYFWGDQKIGLITGDTGLLRDAHLSASGIHKNDLEIGGMEDCDEFQSVVIRREGTLNVEAMKVGVLAVVQNLLRKNQEVKAIVLECSNLASYRSDIQKAFKVPVYDIVTLIDLFAEGYLFKKFKSCF